KGQTIFKTAFGSEVRKSLPFWKPIDKLRQRSDTTTNSSPPPGRRPCRRNFKSRRCRFCICGNDDLEHRVWRKGSRLDPAQGSSGITSVRIRDRKSTRLNSSH